MPLSISGDYKYFDGVETLQFVQGTNAPVTVNYCLREQLTWKELNFGAALGIEPKDLPFNIPGPELPSGVTPQIGNALTDANGVGYTIQSATYDTLTQQHRVITRKKVG